MRFLRIGPLAGLGMLLCLAACGSSPPNQYYRLMPHADPTTARQQPSLGVGPIKIPDYLRRSGIVYSGGGNQLIITELQRWAEPLDEGIKRVLAINLARQLQTDNLRLFPWQLDDMPDYTVEVVVLELDTRANQAVLVTDWVVKHAATGRSVTRDITRLQHPLPPGPIQPAELAPAYSALFYQLSEQIAAVIGAADAADTASAAALPGG